LRCIEEGLDVNAMIRKDRGFRRAFLGTALDYVVYRGRLEIAQLLIQHGAQLEGDGSRVTPLMAAVKSDETDLVELLLKSGASPNTRSQVLDFFDSYIETPLIKAVSYSSVSTIRLLLESGASVDDTDEGGRTALMVASESGKSDVVEVLSEYGPSLEVMDIREFNALRCALASEHQRTAELLLRAGSSVWSRNGIGRTPLHFVMSYVDSTSGRVNEAALLLKYGVPVDAEDVLGTTALHLASAMADAEVVALLLQHKADVTAADGVGRNALHFAVLSSRSAMETIKILLKTRVDINAADDEGNTALMLAKDKDIRQLLMKAQRRRAGERPTFDEIGDFNSDTETLVNYGVGN